MPCGLFPPGKSVPALIIYIEGNGIYLAFHLLFQSSAYPCVIGIHSESIGMFVIWCMSSLVLANASLTLSNTCIFSLFHTMFLVSFLDMRECSGAAMSAKWGVNLIYAQEASNFPLWRWPVFLQNYFHLGTSRHRLPSTNLWPRYSTDACAKEHFASLTVILVCLISSNTCSKAWDAPPMILCTHTHYRYTVICFMSISVENLQNTVGICHIEWM